VFYNIVKAAVVTALVEHALVNFFVLPYLTMLSSIFSCCLYLSSLISVLYRCSFPVNPILAKVDE
jgi:hypothetical protein